MIREEKTEIILVCDESGAKGRADNTERFLGEVGVFAGILLTKELYEEIRVSFNELISQFTDSANKLHITDLKPDQQSQLRKDCFSLIIQHRLQCFYSAIHVAGFNANYEMVAKSREYAKSQRRSSVVLGTNDPKPPLMHTELFVGLYDTIIAYCMERNQTNLSIDILSDNIDKSITKDFLNESGRLLNYSQIKREVTGFDKSKKERVHGKITVDDNMPELPIKVDKISIKTSADEGLVVAADILANSINKMFRDRSKDELYTALNRPPAFDNHPLKDYLDTFWDWGNEDSAVDRLYPHPSMPKNE